MTTRHFCCIALLLTLAATVAAHASLSVARECVYTLYVKTGDVPKAGTDSKISVTLTDKHGESFQIKDLETWGLMSHSHDYFEMGNMDIFSGRDKCLSKPMCKLTLDSDAKGQSPGWYVDYVEINMNMPHEKCAQSTFKINDWLGAEGPPFELNVVLAKCKNYVALA